MITRSAWLLAFTSITLLFTVGMNAYISGKEVGREEMRRVLLPREIPFTTNGTTIGPVLLSPGPGGTRLQPSPIPDGFSLDNPRSGVAFEPGQVAFGPKLIFEDAKTSADHCTRLLEKHVKEFHDQQAAEKSPR